MEVGRIPSPHWTADTLEPLVEALKKAERPIILASPWVSRDPRMATLAAEHGWPVFAIESPRGAADPFLIGGETALREADLLVLLAPWDFSARTADVQHPRALGIIQAWPEIGAVQRWLRRAQGKPGPSARCAGGRVVPENQRLDAAGGGRIVPKHVKRIGAQPLPDGVSGVHPFKLAEAVRRRLTAADYLTMDGGEFVCWLRLGVAQGEWRSSCNGKYGPVRARVSVRARGASGAWRKPGRGCVRR